MITRTLTKGRKVVKNRASKRYSRLMLRLEPLNTEIIDDTAYCFKASGLPKQGTFAKCNPILEIHRLGSDGKFFKVFEALVVKKSQNPNWDKFTLSSSILCNGDEQRALQLKIYHVDNKNVQRKYIGKCQTNYSKLLNDKNKAYALKNTKGKQCGTLTLTEISVLSRQQNTTSKENVDNNMGQAQMSYDYAQSASNAKTEEKIQHDAIRRLQEQKSNRSRAKFLDYLQGGCELSMMIAIDFTGANGQINDPLSLHYIYEQMKPSPYQDAIRQICPIVATYVRFEVPLCSVTYLWT